MTKICLLLVPAMLLSAQTPPPHHLFNPAGRLTGPSSLTPRAIAAGYLRAIAPRYRLAPMDLDSLQVAKEYRTAHNGVTHLVYRQQYQGIDVYNAFWTVNIDRDGSIINAGGTLAPAPSAGLLPPPAPSVLRAIRSAARAVNPEVAGRFAPFQTAPPDVTRRKPARFAPDGFGAEIEAQPMWYSVNGVLTPAWVFYMQDSDGISNYEVVVEDATQAILAKAPSTWFDGPQGMVFDHSSPQPNPHPGTPMTAAPPLIPRTLQPFTGDPVASPSGWVSGNETAGNNAVAGLNRLGINYAAPLTTSASGDFTFPLTLGTGAPNPTNFPDAATVNLFYWANRAHDLFYSLGFDEVAGNYQQNNFGKGGSDGDPILIYSQYGAAAATTPALNNAFYTTQHSGEDGAAAMVATYLALNRNTGVFVDAAFDDEVIVHEYTHGVSTRLIRQFGSTVQGGSMGEAFSDFFSLELTIPDGAPVDGTYPEGAYFQQNFQNGIRTHLYSTDLNVNPLTFARFGTVSGAPEVHADGEIWVEALWETRAAYIRQFGEAEGRRRIRLLLIDAMKLSPPAPSMLDMRDAILVADRVDFEGASQDQIWQAFARRGFGVLAMADSGASVHIVASTDVPSGVPLMRFYDQQLFNGEPVRIQVFDPNAKEDNIRVRLTTVYGDSESVFLDRRGPVYYGILSTTDSNAVVTPGNGALDLVPGDTITAAYSSGGQQVTATVSAKPRYSGFLNASTFDFQNETPLNLHGSGLILSQTLPFAFPFFDQTYTTLNLHNNGVLAFSGPLSIPCPDSPDLQQHAAIAPLWITLTTAGAAQPNEDVYRSTTPDSVTYRFAGEVASSLGTNEPVNFSTTLFTDGRIAFHYGSGNRNLVTLGCANTPIVGISSGHETTVQLSGHSGLTNLENATDVVDYPAFGATSAPQGTLDAPAAGGHVATAFTVSGVRYDSVTSISRLDLLIDGVSMNHSPTTVRRTDFCYAQNVSGCPNVGYSFSVNATGLHLAPGSHTVQVRVTNLRGASTNFPDTPVPFTIDPTEPAPPTGQIETVADGATITATTIVKGYVYAPTLRVLSLDLLVDGVTYGSPTYNLARPDICSTLTPAPPNCPNIGFTFSLNPKSTSLPISVGLHTLAVRARDESGNYTMIPANPLTFTVK